MWTSVIEEQRKLDGKQLHYLYSSLDFIRATKEQEQCGRGINNVWDV